MGLRSQLVGLICKLPMTTDGANGRQEMLRRSGLGELTHLIRNDGSDQEFADGLLHRAAIDGQDEFVSTLLKIAGICPFMGVGPETQNTFEAILDHVRTLTLEEWEQEFDVDWELWKSVVEAASRRFEPADVHAGLYVRREVENEVDAFVADRAHTMLVIVGQSGMGKTTLMRQVLERTQREGHLCFYISSADLPAPMDEAESQIIALVTDHYRTDKNVFETLERKCRQRGCVLLIGIDAVNEYNRANGGIVPTPVDFLVKLDGMAAARKRHGGSIKYIVTLRPETWKRGIIPDRLRIGQSANAYWVTGGEIALQLGRFTAIEAALAYEKYRREFFIESQLGDLPELTRYHLRDPLLLRITAEVHSRGRIPSDLESSDLFRRYEENIAASYLNARPVIAGLVAQMFDGPSVVIRSDTIAWDALLKEKAPELYKDLDPQPHSSPGTRLCEMNVLRFHVERVRFTYDRFAEYLLSNELLLRIRRKAGTERKPIVDIALDAILANLQAGSHLVTVTRALRRVLRLLQDEHNYLNLVRDLARGDERGLALVVSTLGAIAMRVSDRGDQGLATLSSLLSDLRRDVDRWNMITRFSLGLFPLKPIFPVVDAAHRLLVDEEYALWRDGRPVAVRAKHLEMLYECFVWGVFHTSEVMGAAAVQCLFFLWKNPAARVHAIKITDMAVNRVRPIGPGAILPFGGRSLENMMALFLLTLPEVTDQSGTPACLPQARWLIQKLDLGRFAKLGMVAGLLGRYLETVFDRLPYPVNLHEMRLVFASESMQDAFRRCLRLLRREPGRLFSLDEARELSLVPNGLVLQMLCYAISVQYECCSEAERRDILSWMGTLVQKPLSATTDYVLSLSLYHINYFGSHATQESIVLMGTMVTNILRKRKGHFKLVERTYDYNVIGTYGRVLRKHASKIVGYRDIPREPMLNYALDALADAESRADFDHYLYVCSNVGLLGLLTEPEYVFEVFSHVIETLKVRDATHQLTGIFSTDRIRREIIQSLANIRVLYRAQVDRWLLEVLEDQELYGQVLQRTGQFDLTVFCSWTSEHLLFKLLADHYDSVGRGIVECLDEGLSTGSPVESFRYALEQLFKSLLKISENPPNKSTGGK